MDFFVFIFGITDLLLRQINNYIHELLMLLFFFCTKLTIIETNMWIDRLLNS